MRHIRRERLVLDTRWRREVSRKPPDRVGEVQEDPAGDLYSKGYWVSIFN